MSAPYHSVGKQLDQFTIAIGDLPNVLNLEETFRINIISTCKAHPELALGAPKLFMAPSRLSGDARRTCANESGSPRFVQLIRVIASDPFAPG